MWEFRESQMTISGLLRHNPKTCSSPKLIAGKSAGTLMWFRDEDGVIMRLSSTANDARVSACSKTEERKVPAFRHCGKSRSHCYDWKLCACVSANVVGFQARRAKIGPWRNIRRSGVFSSSWHCNGLDI